ncbi:MAG TPA: hypothetical protein VGQ78_06110 [Vicinamibacteria bacterium]|nr:hypothetical protein [Vicinamibacteria bacterium]
MNLPKVASALRKDWEAQIASAREQIQKQLRETGEFKIHEAGRVITIRLRSHAASR